MTGHPDSETPFNGNWEACDSHASAYAWVDPARPPWPAMVRAVIEGIGDGTELTFTADDARGLAALLTAGAAIADGLNRQAWARKRDGDS